MTTTASVYKNNKPTIDVSSLLQEIEKIQQISSTTSSVQNSIQQINKFEQMLRALVVLEGSILLANPSITSEQMYQQIYCNKENRVSAILTVEAFNVSYEFAKLNYMNYIRDVYAHIFIKKERLK
jgi:hypothetical protein